MKTRFGASQEAAKTLAIQALAFIAEDEHHLAAFLSATGLTSQGIRQAASQPDFLAGVLDHMLSDERLLMAFADRAGINPAALAKARGALGGQWERDTP